MGRLSNMKSLMALLSSAVLCGCADSARPEQARLTITSSPELVMFAPQASDDLATNQSSVESQGRLIDLFAGRNDDRLGGLPGDRVASIEYLEVRQREYLRTINGRPREFSTTRISTLKRGIVQ